MQSSFQHKPIHIEPLIADIINNVESNGDVINNGKHDAKHIDTINNIPQTKVNINVIDFILSIVFII